MGWIRFTEARRGTLGCRPMHAPRIKAYRAVIGRACSSGASSQSHEAKPFLTNRQGTAPTRLSGIGLLSKRHVGAREVWDLLADRSSSSIACRRVLGEPCPPRSRSDVVTTYTIHSPMSGKRRQTDMTSALIGCFPDARMRDLTLCIAACGGWPRLWDCA